METQEKIQYMTNEESYTQRRMLFKDIWETAMNFDEKDDIMNKPKVIKTLRLDEVDKCVVGKTKKQRIKNLRHVCNRILDFCDKQDADDVFYEEMATHDEEQVKTIHKIQAKIPKKKLHRIKKKIIMAKSLMDPKDVQVMQTIITVGKPAVKRKSLNNPQKKSRKSNVKTIKPKPRPVLKTMLPASPVGAVSLSIRSTESHQSANRQKSVKKKHSKRKKLLESAVQATGIMKTKTGHISSASPKQRLSKQLPQRPKIMIG